MAGDSLFWLLLASVVMSRWLVAWAQAEITLWLVVAASAVTLLWFTTPMLANLGGNDLEYWLSHYGKVIAIVICLEAWLFNTVLSHHGYLSPMSWVALLYVQSLLFQSGYFAFSFDSQSLLLAAAILTAGVLFRFLPRYISLLVSPTISPIVLSRDAAAEPTHLKTINRIHLVLVWIVTWLGLSSWPNAIPIDSNHHLRDTALTGVAMVLFALVSLSFHYCLTTAKLIWAEKYKA